MILGFDVGNTTTVVGCFQREAIEPFASLRIISEPKITVDELYHKICSLLKRKGISLQNDVSGAIYSSVVPNLDGIYQRMLQQELGVKPVIVTNQIRSELELRYDNPKDIGADRIVNAVGARKLYGDKGDLIIIDFGTATTFCVVLKEGVYQGGIIAPGLSMSMNALFEKTAKLPKVSFERPPFVVGTSTVSSIQSGFYFGWVAMINGIVRRISQQLDRKFFTILTGGYSKDLTADLNFEHIVDEDLTLKGLKILYDINHN